MSEHGVPTLRPWLVKGFRKYSRGLLRKNFHTISVERSMLDLNAIGDRPLIVAANHASWWDPLIAALLCESLFPQRSMYAPIDATALSKYRILGQMGFYGLDLHTRHGAESFLKISKAILQIPSSSIWLTPEGRFCDVRDRSAPLMPGIAHLASKISDLAVVCIAIEYTYWEESRPEVICHVATPLMNRDGLWTKKDWQGKLEQQLRTAQDQLAQRSIARDTQGLQILSRRGKKTESWYDFLRYWWARIQGKSIELHHGAKFEDGEASS
ncbi:MAG: lysophospholipid acyltransferase family protein [Pirellulales bacterium]